MLGQSESPLAQTIIPDLLNYTHDTSHEKIVRALALAIAMMVYGKEEGADTIIEQLSKDRGELGLGSRLGLGLLYC
jgi:26S proteasome regulatory subunit N2